MRKPPLAPSVDYDGLGYTSTPARTYLCAGCWRRFPEAMLVVVPERTGRGFRCPACAVAEGGAE